MKLDQFETKLGYQFSKQSLLQRALTHRSYGHKHNERLEFLGDSILNFTVAMLLFKQLTTVDEGDLSRIRSSLVNQGTLANLANQLQMSEVLRLGEGELKSGGFKRPSILADALEAVFAAIYLDSDMEHVQKVISDLYQPLLANLDVKTAGKDSKTLLQEIVQSQHMALPQYAIIETRGEAHHQEFIVQCRLPQFDIVTEASGLSRRQAEQDAASAAISKIQGLLADPTTSKKHRKVSQLSLAVATRQEPSHD
ncbi:ribonuclease III [Brackiella oedipodis]|uniref:ribonuclease III n=1 Tax=Brackiella oedipodis TaxID=124225 RepID=UPI000490EB22|nr:ribonuclease III [Brackiella oedipodis]